MSNILVVVAHSDDESLGMGATIAKHAASGDTIRLIVMTDGVGARSENKQALTERQQSLNNACEILGIEKHYCHDFPDNQMDTVSILTVTQVIEQVLAEYPADKVYTHSSRDLNIDHQVTHRAVMTACRPQPGSSVRTILTFEVRSATEWQASSMQPFIANCFIDVSEFFDKKMSALNCYEQELRPFPHSRSKQAIEAQAIERGCSVGVQFAEAFYIERTIN